MTNPAVALPPDTGGRRWLAPGVRGIGAASFLADVGHEIPSALLPSLLTTTLGAPAAALGVIEGVSDALAGAARFGGGVLADDPARRRKVAVGGYTTTAVLGAAVAGATTVWQVAFLRAASWTARGLRVPARNALLADLVPASAYGRAYGFERMMDNLGAIFGPLLALGLVAWLGVQWAIGLSVIPGLLAAAAILYAIRRTPRPTARDKVPLKIRIRPLLSGSLGRLLASVSAFEAGNVAATLLILRATELLTPAHGDTGATTIALALYTAYNVAAAATSVPAGRLSDRLGTRGPVLVLAGGVAAFALSYGLFAGAGTGVAVLAVPFLLAGIGIGAVETAEHAAVAALAPKELRGSTFGLLATVQSLGNLAASAVAGVLWTAVSPTAAFGYLAAWMVIALAGLLSSARR
ncbi:MFS transporter [Kitasatospora sp. DSM 101779]|uniref:MFS transporter n=1 Tax=Kitasatospora sp. DSM 101779 TaxID=2853165 RepID=UPI0021D97662|nr:MFS transporter [Kitasatospora sp. DSM 101779]MCU7821013.1 MFS transporter [Kitasatospora sp. DSM 101779]